MGRRRSFPRRKGRVHLRAAHGSTHRGLVLVGTSHPRDFSLADVTFPVTSIYGTRDTVADADKSTEPPESATIHALVPIAGGNHSQFGTGFQPELAGHDFARGSAEADAPGHPGHAAGRQPIAESSP